MRPRAHPRASRHDAGFALVEMLVAMVLLSLVGLTLARFQSFQLAGTAGIAAAAAARLEADNRAIDVLAAPAAPAAEESGTSFNAGREWAWTLSPGPSPNPELMPDMVTVGVSIRATPGGPVLAARQVMRPRVWSNVSQGGGSA